MRGAPDWIDPDALALALADPDTRAGLAAAVPAALERLAAGDATPRTIAADERVHTVGDWGTGAPNAPSG